MSQATLAQNDLFAGLVYLLAVDNPLPLALLILLWLQRVDHGNIPRNTSFDPMAPAICKACGNATLIDDDAGLVCGNCGDVADPNHVVLSMDDFEGRTFGGPKILKSGRGRVLPGQSEQARDAAHHAEMREKLTRLADTLGVSDKLERAHNLFKNAMNTGKFRWGRTARLVAGACLSIALRFDNRPELFGNIADQLEEKITTVTRAFSSVVSALELRKTDGSAPPLLPTSLPRSYIAELGVHLSSALANPESSGIPASAVTFLRTLSLNSISETARALSDLVMERDLASPVASLPVPATACAVMLLAIEAEARTPFSNLGEMASFLGSFVRHKGPLIMARYKVLQDDLLGRIHKIEWLDHYEPNSGKCGRAKVPRRMVVARGIKTVLHREKTEGNREDASCAPRPQKRRKIEALQVATSFLANPLVGPLPSSFLVAPSGTQVVPLSLPTYLLTTFHSTRENQLPSRLRLLTIARGGVGPEEVGDDELFDTGELEKIFRAPDEVAQMRVLHGWDKLDEEQSPRKEPSRAKVGNVARRDLDELVQFGSDDTSDQGFMAGVPRALIDQDDDDDDDALLLPMPDDDYVVDLIVED
ncbi:unnamed protein product [Mycena citricolor]|uniref:B-related factor 1 n=1 Tax=Mycena citricolor TaxID=2018698 RepID=A0AAD2HM97_9AGAR|nr:unnamed protein product [Mycena citricolor]